MTGYSTTSFSFSCSSRHLLGKQVVDTYLNKIRIVEGLSHSYGFKYEFFWLPLSVEGQEPIYKLAVEKTEPLMRAKGAAICTI